MLVFKIQGNLYAELGKSNFNEHFIVGLNSFLIIQNSFLGVILPCTVKKV